MMMAMDMPTTGVVHVLPQVPETFATTPSALGITSEEGSGNSGSNAFLRPGSCPQSAMKSQAPAKDFSVGTRDVFLQVNGTGPELAQSSVQNNLFQEAQEPSCAQGKTKTNLHLGDSGRCNESKAGVTVIFDAVVQGHTRSMPLSSAHVHLTKEDICYRAEDTTVAPLAAAPAFPNAASPCTPSPSALAPPFGRALFAESSNTFDAVEDKKIGESNLDGFSESCLASSSDEDDDDEVAATPHVANNFTTQFNHRSLFQASLSQSQTSAQKSFPISDKAASKSPSFYGTVSTAVDSKICQGTAAAFSSEPVSSRRRLERESDSYSMLQCSKGQDIDLPYRASRASSIAKSRSRPPNEPSAYRGLHMISADLDVPMIHCLICDEPLPDRSALKVVK